MSGNYNNGLNAGPLYVNANNAASNSNSNNGARLQEWLQNKLRVTCAPLPLGKNTRCFVKHPNYSCVMNNLQDKISIENIANYGNALLAHANAKRGKKNYYEIPQFEKHLTDNLHELCDEFTTGTYRTKGYIVSKILDGTSKKERTIAKVCYRDRVAQWMIAIQYQPYYLSILHPNTHAAIPGRGIHSALLSTEKYVRVNKYKWCLKFDIRHYFESINRTVLKQQMEEDIPDKTILKIVCGIIDDAPMTGIPIGNYSSQYLANRYLCQFDFWLGERADFVRYMDDVVVFGDSKDELIKLFREIEWFLLRNLYLEIKSNWQVFKISDRGIDFVGYRVFPDKTILRKRAFRDTRRVTISLGKKVQHGGELTYSEICSLMSRLGWVFPTSPDSKQYIWRRYFLPIGLDVKKNTIKKLY